MNKWIALLITGLLIFLGLAIYIGGGKYFNPPKIPAETLAKVNAVKSETKEKEYSPTFIEDRGKIIYSPMGDSLTDGYYATTEKTKFTSVFAKKIEDELGYSVSIDGIAEYGGFLERGVKGAPFIREKNPDLVTIEYGTNDSDPNNIKITPEKFENQLNDLIDTLTEDNEKPPVIVLVTTWNQGSKAIPFDDVIKKVGEERKLPVAEVKDIWLQVDNKGPEGIETVFGLSDNWHPNDKGMKLIAEEIFRVAAPLLDKQ